VFSQPLVGVLMCMGALVLVTRAWTAGPASWRPGESTLEVILCAASLVVAVVLTFQFPIHIRQHTKVHMNSVPLYLMVVLLPPPLAAATVGVAMLSGELSVSRQRQGSVGATLTQVGRWVIVAFVGSIVAHTGASDTRSMAVACAGAAVVLFVGDLLTSPILFSPITGESPLCVLRNMAREASLPEGAQYLVGLLGAMVAEREIWSLALLLLPTVLVYLAFKSAKELREGTRQILESMADTVDLRDQYMGGHSRRVTELAAGILQQLRLEGPEAHMVLAAARLHDIGKLGLPDDLLKREGELSEDEKAVVQTHAERGAELLMRYPDFARGVEMVRHHHERWDGSGYPHRLKEKEIPLGARIIAVANTFDSMTSDRPRRSALLADQAVTILREGRGKQWDPAIVDAFLRSIADRLEHPGAPILRIVPRLDKGSEATA
jgi:hypothetical protein